ncbi:SRPBCC family protein [Actinoplanes sp. TRM 88003]|uniref:SRPBCC family protein n=1 Tax=Paractinoplanes aksuensis TaxID=2939490 RepID=A0ABT1DSM9_9ACTN|nr:SRPBCC family protein [Actinoplanes aksuensis]MCO8273081.1 SRPBCC family protein [Actinoplanes aksuensis]
MERDRIERDTFVKASVERVWAVITEPAHVGVWFGQGEPAEIELWPGGIMRLDHGQYGVFPTLIVAVEPPRYLAYRWASGFPGEVADEGNSTLVEFFVEPEADGTRLRVVETGFASMKVPLPPEREETAGYDSHNEGWRGIVEIVREYAEK